MCSRIHRSRPAPSIYGVIHLYHDLDRNYEFNIPNATAFVAKVESDEGVEFVLADGSSTKIEGKYVLNYERLLALIGTGFTPL